MKQKQFKKKNLQKILKKRHKLIISKSTSKKINIGIQILRMICCFIIILCHFYAFYHLKIIREEYIYSIILFFFISFYFSYNTLSCRNVPKIKERFKRMLIPYIIWPLLFYLKDKFYHYLYHTREEYNIKNLYYQFLIGCKIYGIFWFLFNIIFLSTFFTIIAIFFKDRFIIALFIIYICDYLFYYSNFAGTYVLNKFKKVPVHHSIKPIFEFFIYAFTGLYFSSINLLNIFHIHRIKIIVFSIIITFIFIKCYFSFKSEIKFFYSGIIKNIFIFNLFALFASIPFDKINNNIIFNLLNELTSYTGGIYYIHVKIGDLCREYIYINKKNTFKGCLLIYLFCYLICFFGTFILKKSFLKYLFI